MQNRDRNVRSLIEAASVLIEIADKGHAECQDANCVGLFGLAKDCGYRIRAEAEREFSAHSAGLDKKGLKR
jgi:hypothetical protein